MLDGDVVIIGNWDLSAFFGRKRAHPNLKR